MPHASPAPTYPDQPRAPQVAPTMLRLENTLEQLRQQEMRRFQKKLSTAEAGRLDDLSRTLMQRYLRRPMLQVSAASQRGEMAPVLAMLTEMFALEGPGVRG